MNDTAIQVVLERQVQAPPATVFRAWTDPRQLSQWFAPGSVEMIRAETDPRVGGRYRIQMRDPTTGKEYVVCGEYLEVVENEKLVFDWQWHDGVERTEVTVELEAHDAGTLVGLTHRGFGRPEFADRHRDRWTGCLDNLAKHAS